LRKITMLLEKRQHLQHQFQQPFTNSNQVQLCAYSLV